MAWLSSVPVRRTLGNVAGAIDDQPDHRALHLGQRDAGGQLKSTRWWSRRWPATAPVSSRLVSSLPRMATAETPCPLQAADHAVEPHFGVEAAQVFEVNQGQLVAVKLGEGRRAGAQAARPLTGRLRVAPANNCVWAGRARRKTSSMVVVLLYILHVLRLDESRLQRLV